MHRHVALAALVAIAAALRVTALVAVYPGIWFSDTNGYVAAAATGQLSRLRVDGYSLVVAPFYRLGSAGALIVTQHLIGLAIVVVLYALLVRRGVPRWLALLAVVPAALDAYLIDIEHMIMSETVFHASIVAGVAVLLWNERSGPWLAAAAGLLLGYAATVRSVALPFVVVVVPYLLLRRAGLRQVAGFCAGWALAVGGYGALYAAQHGRFGFTGYDGRFLYAQIAPYADCAQVAGVPATERPLCPTPSHRLSRNSYLWSPRSPIHRLPTSANGVIRDFAMRVIRDNPLGYLRVVSANFAHYFEPGHHTGRDDYSETAWQFPSDPNHWIYPAYRGPIRPARVHRIHPTEPGRYITPMVGRPHTNVTASRILHYYQEIAYSSGQVLAPCLLVVLVALARRRGSRRLRLDAALLTGTALLALLMAAALSLFDYRYGLGAAILLPAAAALAGTALLRPAHAEP